MAFDKYQTLYEEKSATILDVSKARMQFFSAQSEMEKNNLALENLLISLKTLNAGKKIDVIDTLYYSENETISYDEFSTKLNENDFNLQFAKQWVIVREQELKLSKNKRLPNFELGYKYANEENLQFNGVVFGMSIPLWAGKKEVRASEAHFVVSELELQNEQSNLDREIEIRYKNYTITQKLYVEYKSTLESLTILESLNKQFELNNMTSYEYYSQLSEYYQLHIDFLAAEYSYYQAVLALEKYSL